MQKLQILLIATAAATTGIAGPIHADALRDAALEIFRPLPSTVPEGILVENNVSATPLNAITGINMSPMLICAVVVAVLLRLNRLSEQTVGFLLLAAAGAGSRSHYRTVGGADAIGVDVR